MNVLMILSNPFMVDPRVHKEAKALVEKGYNVIVVSWDRKHQYKKEKIVDGIRLVRIHNSRFMEMLPGDLWRNPFWWRKAYKKSLELYENGFDFDVVHCHDLDTLKTGVWLKKKTGCKLIYDAHEIFGYMISESIPVFIEKYVYYMERKLVKKVDTVITVNDLIKNYFEKFSSVPVEVVMNCKRLKSKKYQPTKNSVFTALFIGNLHRRRLFPEIVDGLGEVSDIKFVIAAKKENLGLYKSVQNVASKYDNVDFLGEISFKKVLSKTFQSDVVIQPFDPTRKSASVSTPNKLFEAMACGRPIISTKGTNPGNIVEELSCGLSVEYNVDSYKEGVKKLRDNPDLCKNLGKNGLKAAVEKYNWENQKRKLINLYRDLEDVK